MTPESRVCARPQLGSVRFSCASRSCGCLHTGERGRTRERTEYEPSENHARGRSGERDNLPNCDDDDDDKEEEEDSFEKQRDEDDDDDGEWFGRCR